MAVAIGTAEDAGRSAPATSQVGGTRTTRSHEPRRTAVVRHPSGAGQTLRTRGTVCGGVERVERGAVSDTRQLGLYAIRDTPPYGRSYGGPTKNRATANPGGGAPRRGRPLRRAPAAPRARSARSAALKRFPAPGPEATGGRARGRDPAGGPRADLGFLFRARRTNPLPGRGRAAGGERRAQPPDRRRPPRAAVDPA